MKRLTYAFVVSLVGFYFLIHAQLTPRPVKYSMKELGWWATLGGLSRKNKLTN